MQLIDIIYILKWFFIFFVIGIVFLPITLSLFNNFRDKGYIFSKIIGVGVLSYLVFILGILKIAKLSLPTILICLTVLFFINYFHIKRNVIFLTIKKHFKIFIIEEIIFLLAIIFWSFVRSNNPDINGLEKFMDFGFVNSILRSDYFPPKDMWYTPLSINYYYFGHLMTAVLTKITQIPSFISFNLMISTIFALTFASSFSIAMNLFYEIKSFIRPTIAGLLTAILLTFGGNLTTIYTFFKPYVPADSPVPFWKLPLLPFTFPNDFWYPNATRFIPFTIHEFPIYSFVVSDLHGHVLDIPFVFLIIALSLSIFIEKSVKLFHLTIFSFILSVMYMTNAWDGFIYIILTMFIILSINFPKNNWKNIFTGSYFYESLKKIITIVFGFLVFSLPFSINFKPFVSGVGVLCAPTILTNLGRVGPFLFEANHCQKSPVWQLFMLYGFFYFFVLSFISFLKFKKKYVFTTSDIFVLILIILSTFLIIVPELIYIKDIYPMHYRANTMFKLVYQSFILLSLSSGYIFFKLLFNIKTKIIKFVFFIIAVFLSFFILIYPIFAINSYYKDLKTYDSLDGLKYLRLSYPEDYKLITWINKNIGDQPVILEANGESYTEYARISTYTGLPTVIGWPVHEWLWRGSYDYAAPRIEDVRVLYVEKNISQIKKLLKRYNINYVVISSLEKTKYPNLDENKFKTLGKIVYKNEKATLYKINSEVLR